MSQSGADPSFETDIHTQQARRGQELAAAAQDQAKAQVQQKLKQAAQQIAQSQQKVEQATQNINQQGRTARDLAQAQRKVDQATQHVNQKLADAAAKQGHVQQKIDRTNLQAQQKIIQASEKQAQALERASQKVDQALRNRAQQEQNAEDNRAKAQQNRDKAAQNRAQKEQNREEKSAVQSKAPEAAGKVDTSQKQKQKAGKKDSSRPAPANKKNKAPTQFKSKVVIRRLPPNLPEEVFWKAVSPWIRDSADTAALNPPEGTQAEASRSTTQAVPTVDFKRFIPGKLKTDANKQNKHARAYVRFLSPAHLVEFHKAFDGHIFRDAKGRESAAIVEFAPYQKVVLPSASNTGGRSRRNKPDPKHGSIEKDADYQSFLELLSKAESGEGAKKSEGDLLASLYDPKEKEREREKAALQGKSTPLLEHLRALKAAKKESAAAVKKAKKLDKAVAKKAAAKGSASKAGEGGKSKEGRRDKAKALEPEALAAREENAKAKALARKEKKKQKRKAKAQEAAAVRDGNNVDAPKDTSAQGGPPKNAPKGQSKKKLEHNISAGATTSEAGESNKDKDKGKPRRRKGPSKDSSSGSTPAPQSGKVQILKRDS